MTLFERSAGASRLHLLHLYIVFYQYHPYASPYIDSSLITRIVYFDYPPPPSFVPSPRVTQLPTGHSPPHLVLSSPPSSHLPLFPLSPSRPTPRNKSGPIHTLSTSHLKNPRDCTPPTHTIIHNPPSNSISLFIPPMSVDSDLSFYAYYIFHEKTFVTGGWCFDGDRTRALLKALTTGICCFLAHPTTYILVSSFFFFLPNSVVVSYIPRLQKHRYLPFSNSLAALIPRLLNVSPSRSIQL